MSNTVYVHADHHHAVMYIYSLYTYSRFAISSHITMMISRRVYHICIPQLSHYIIPTITIIIVVRGRRFGSTIIIWHVFVPKTIKSHINLPTHILIMYYAYYTNRFTNYTHLFVFLKNVVIFKIWFLEFSTYPCRRPYSWIFTKKSIFFVTIIKERIRVIPISVYKMIESLPSSRYKLFSRL